MSSFTKILGDAQLPSPVGTDEMLALLARLSRWTSAANGDNLNPQLFPHVEAGAMMRFSKISVTSKGVELVRQTKDISTGDVEEVHLTSAESPLISFSDALNAFVPFVEVLIDSPEHWRKELKVTTLNLSDDKNGLRGLIVTAIRPLAKAQDKPLVLNTPLVREKSIDSEAVYDFNLSDEVMQLIRNAEREAERYVKHERMQMNLFKSAELKSDDGVPDNATEFDANAAHAENVSTRKPRQRLTHKKATSSSRLDGKRQRDRSKSVDSE